MTNRFFAGIDVGTGSARVGLFSESGELQSTASKNITMWHPQPDYAEQSSTNIWAAICHAMHAALEEGGISAAQVCGIGFDATCSLVAVDENNAPVTISPTGEDDRNIIVWMDHRATAQAKRIEALNDPILQYTGGKISPEMEVPKLLWLKENMPESFGRIAHFFDLPDWLVHRATGTFVRSLCSTTCKWTYESPKGTEGEGWSESFFAALDLDEVLEDNARKIGQHFAQPGTSVGEGLSEQAAAELGLQPGTPVGTSLIDAYAGALGTLGTETTGTDAGQGEKLALISGTSACHIVTTTDPVFVPGVWGPYFSSLTPERWVNEAGQSFAGALIDRIIAGHAAAPELREKAEANNTNIYTILQAELEALSGEETQTHLLTSDLHVQPDFLGNRSPLADPTRKGAIVGLTPQTDLASLARQYLATLQALAYGTRQIIEQLNDKGVGIDTIVVSGGLAQNKLYLREHADATGCTILVPETKEPVLLGSAMLGAMAGGQFNSLEQAMKMMSGGAAQISPRGTAVRRYHDAKYQVFLKMQSDYAAYQALMQSEE
ncbi:xylulokinase [Maritalea myrionectae]|uniref:Xylulokinase n=1 Tax=Maritalea myrionectae TaxID=454601 RepID=A0A2R4MBQ7_9HYPH|nr:FGGY-family carbohydrate kinase [Maritalea myrionectae]AVX03468.1 xylulokinase [Maritalea myrionectae]